MAVPVVQLSEFVDDCGQFMADESEHLVVAAVGKAAVNFAQLSLQNGFVLSKKSRVVASDISMAQDIAHRCAPYVSLQTEMFASYLGVDITSNAIRGFVKRRERKQKAAKRNARVLQLRLKRARVWVASVAVMKQQSYGWAADGLSPSERKRQRGLLSRHAGWKPGMCSTTLLEIVCPLQNPDWIAPVREMKEYLEFWIASPELREEIDNYWFAVENATSVNGMTVWRKVVGPVGAVQAALREAGFGWRSSTEWICHAGVTWKLHGEHTDCTDFLLTFGRAMQIKAWEQASKQHL